MIDFTGRQSWFLQKESERAVVRPEDLISNDAVSKPGEESGRHEDVVQSPANILSFN